MSNRLILSFTLIGTLVGLHGAFSAQPRCSGHDNQEPNKPFAVILAQTSGDFDQFLNSFLVPQSKDTGPFQRASDVARAFDRFMGENGFTPMARGLAVGTTPFHTFDEYNRRPRPIVRESWLRSIAESPKPLLAQVDRVVTKRIDSSIVLCRSDVDNRTTALSVMIAGGDVRIKNAESSMIFAAGDVTLASGTQDVLVVAGGKITIAGPISNYFLVTPEKVEVTEPRFIRHARTTVVYEGSRRPAPELFRFAALADYGMKAVNDQGRIRIQIVRKDTSPFHDILKERDIIIKVGGEQVESLGQFRRLMSHAVRIRRLDAKVERSGRTVRVQSAVKKSALTR